MTSISTPSESFISNPISSRIESVDAEQARIEKIWQERAFAMAKELPKEEASGEIIAVVLMQVGGELLGIDVHYVLDIRPHKAITRVPRVPAWVAGVTNWHGSIVSVVDLRAFLDFPTGATRSEEKNPGMLVVVRSQNGKLHGQNNEVDIIFLVDDVLSVETLNIQQSDGSRNQIHGIPDEYNHSLATRTLGAVTDNKNIEQQFSVVLDVEAIFADRRWIINESNG